LVRRMEEFGLSNVRVDRVGNAIGEVGEGEPEVLLCGHIDTITGQIPVKFESGRVYGRGAVDAKSALAAMVVAASRFVDKPIKGTVKVAGVVDEEGRGKGIRHLSDEIGDVDFAIFGEPSGLSNITIGYKGKISLKVHCSTQPAHISGDLAHQKNAIEAAYSLWKEIKNITETDREVYKKPFDSLTAAITGIQGGGPSNVTPYECNFSVDIRVPPRLSCGEAWGFIESNLRSFIDAHSETQFRFEVEDRVEPVVVDKGTILIRALTRSIIRSIKKPVRFLKKTGTGDMNIFALNHHVPMATYGPGDSKLSHTFNEHIEVEEYVRSIDVLEMTVNELFQRWKKD